MILLISILILASVSLLVMFLVQFLSHLNEKIKSMPEKNQNNPIRQRRNMGYKIDKKHTILLFVATIIAAAIIAVMLFNKSLLAIILAELIGLFVAATWVKGVYARFVRKFEVQLPDALMILTSCLKGGLSLIQAMEVLVEEMPSPTNQEFNQILRENKMGISLEESLRRLNNRIRSDDLVLLSSAIMVSRETGGDLTAVFARLNDSIRQRNKLLENVKTLTFQGKIQSYVLTALPVVFIFTIYKINPNYFELMRSTETGRFLLIIAGCLLTIGLFLIRLFGRVEV